MVEKILPPPIQISRTCKYIILNDKRYLAGKIKLRIFKWGSYSGLSGGANVIARVLTSNRGRQEHQKGRRIWGNGSRVQRDVITSWKGLGTKKCGQPLEAGKSKQRNSPLESPKGIQPC